MVDIPDKPKWKSMKKYLGCENCNKECKYRSNYGKPKTLLDCRKNAVIFEFFINWVSAVPIPYMYWKVFHITSGKIFFSVLISLIILALYDLFFCLIEKSCIAFFEYLEKNRRKKYEEEIQAIKELEEKNKEEEEIKKEKERIRFQEVESAVEIYKQLEILKGIDPIRKKFSKGYEEMLCALKEVCDDLEPEHFANATTRSLFKVYLPELLKEYKKFIRQYNEGVLSEKEIRLFQKLLKTSKIRFIKAKRVLWEEENTSLYVNMLALEEALSSTNNRIKENKNENSKADCNMGNSLNN